MSGDEHSLQDWGAPCTGGAGPGRLLSTPSVLDDAMRPQSGTEKTPDAFSPPRLRPRLPGAAAVSSRTLLGTPMVTTGDWPQERTLGEEGLGRASHPRLGDTDSVAGPQTGRGCRLAGRAGGFGRGRPASASWPQKLTLSASPTALDVGPEPMADNVSP